MKIFNLTGQNVFETKLNTENSIDIANLQAGIYILRLTDGEKIYNTKIIIE